MFRWITKTRLHTALAVIFFALLFAASIPFIIWGFTLGAASDATSSGSGGVTTILGLLTGIVSFIGTISTIILAWRADRRTAKESDLKMFKLQQQIAEMQAKLSAADKSVLVVGVRNPELE